MSSGKRWTLLILRIAALGGILFFFLDLEQRSQREVVRNSRAIVLVDTSLSMGIQDVTPAGQQRRIDRVVQELEDGQLLRRLRDKHDVVIQRFDETTTPVEVASYTKRTPAAAAVVSVRNRRRVNDVRWPMVIP